jgi:hypothetical protein
MTPPPHISIPFPHACRCSSNAFQECHIYQLKFHPILPSPHSEASAMPSSVPAMGKSGLIVCRVRQRRAPQHGPTRSRRLRMGCHSGSICLGGRELHTSGTIVHTAAMPGREVGRFFSAVPGSGPSVSCAYIYVHPGFKCFTLSVTMGRLYVPRTCADLVITASSGRRR